MNVSMRGGGRKNRSCVRQQMYGKINSATQADREPPLTVADEFGCKSQVEVSVAVFMCKDLFFLVCFVFFFFEGGRRGGGH